MNSLNSDRLFEDEVRRIARLLWPSAQFGGAQMIEGRERDGVFESDEYIHCIECTVSRQLAKAKEDADKLNKLCRRLAAKHPEKFVKGWFVTRYEPTADQRSVFKKLQGKIVPLSIDQFRSKLVDIRTYLASRSRYPFGSVRDPKTNASDFSFDYIPLDLITEDGTILNIDQIGTGVAEGKRYIIVGDYGAGKSSTLRELYRELEKRFDHQLCAAFPLLLNLRDHHGQTDPVEAIERHARRIGYPEPSQLVRAWRAGYCHLLLDGFDEIATAGWAGSSKKLHDLRYLSMELIRGIGRESPRGQGIVIAGRGNFFDSKSELLTAMAITSGFEILSLSEFSYYQVTSFLNRLGWKGSIPEWLPTRPLLLSYLYHRGLLFSESDSREIISPAEGWHELLDRVSAREAEIEAGIDPTTVRRIIESIATDARATTDGLGPLTPDSILSCFKRVCGYPPDDRAMVLLQRLPGLGAPNVEDGSRPFIDKDFAEAARSGDVFRFIESPFNNALDSDSWQSSLQQLGSDIVAHRVEEAGFSQGKICAAIVAAHDKSRGDTLVADIILTLLAIGHSWNGSRLYISGVFFDTLVVEQPESLLDGIEFQDCVFSSLRISPDIPQGILPSFVRCHIGRFEGRSGVRDIPADKFLECTVDEYESSTKTTSGIMLLTLPLQVKVLLTIFKKIFAQSGSGRKEAALFRGLDARARELVPELLDLLKREGFLVRSRQRNLVIWLPSKTADVRRRALSILASPLISSDRILSMAEEVIPKGTAK